MSSIVVFGQVAITHLDALEDQHKVLPVCDGLQLCRELELIRKLLLQEICILPRVLPLDPSEDVERLPALLVQEEVIEDAGAGWRDPRVLQMSDLALNL
jgi:hypothetical protein